MITVSNLLCGTQYHTRVDTEVIVLIPWIIGLLSIVYLLWNDIRIAILRKNTVHTGMLWDYIIYGTEVKTNQRCAKNAEDWFLSLFYIDVRVEMYKYSIIQWNISISFKSKRKIINIGNRL